MKEIKISQVDALFTNGRYPIEFLFFYKESLPTERVRRALLRLSTIFWPAFGEYRDGRIFFDSYRQDDFYAEENSDEEFPLSKAKEKGIELIARFSLPEMKKLFSVKTVRMKNGMVLIPKLNHLAGDGYSYFFLLSVLAALSRAAAVPFKSSLMKLLLRPHHCRAILKGFAFKGMEDRPILPESKLRIEIEEIPRREVQRMLEEIALKLNFRVSSNDLLTAIALKKLAGRQIEDGLGEFNLTIPIDVRRRVKEYGLRFFGNGIMMWTVPFKKAGLENRRTEEIAVQIRKAMPSVTKELFVNYLIGLEGLLSAGKIDQFKPFDPESGCLVTNLSKLPADKLDFGSGGPDLVIPLTIEKNSTAILAGRESFILRYAY
jgi:hypothetical protein